MITSAGLALCASLNIAASECTIDKVWLPSTGYTIEDIRPDEAGEPSEECVLFDERTDPTGHYRTYLCKGTEE